MWISVFNSKIKIYTFYTFLLKFKIMYINNIKVKSDYNAALNILDEGLRIIGCSTSEFTLVDYPTMDELGID